MKRSGIVLGLMVAVLAAAGYAQETLTFDFEGISDPWELAAAGWVLADDQNHEVDGTLMNFPGTIQLETSIVHGGSQALRLGAWDIAYLPVNGQFGTLDLWVYDYGWRLRDKYGVAYASEADGPRFGLRKFMDVDTSVYYPDNEPADYGVLRRGFGIGAGLIERTYLDSTGGYGAEWGVTLPLDIATIADPTLIYDPGCPYLNSGWAGDQKWFSPSWFGVPGGRPLWVYDDDGNVLVEGGGWNHWRIAYLAPGEVEITMVESWAGYGRTGVGTPAHAFDGTVAGGVDDICLYGGRGMIPDLEPELWFGDGIYDDITWTPAPVPRRPGDADGDDDVDLDDFILLKYYFGDSPLEDDRADFDHDGDIDLDDFVILKYNFGT